MNTAKACQFMEFDIELVTSEGKNKLVLEKLDAVNGLVLLLDRHYFSVNCENSC